MENSYLSTHENKQKRVLSGLIGALLGALIGAVIWCLVSVGTEHIYAMVGTIVGLIVGYGYDLLKGRKGTIRMVIVFLCVILSVTMGTIGTYGWWIHEWYVEENDFIANATKQELAEAYLTSEELAELNSYPAALKQRVLNDFEVTMPSEFEYYRLYLEDPAFLGDVGGECISSILFALLGSFALILSNGKRSSTMETSEATFTAEAVAHDLAQQEENADSQA